MLDRVKYVEERVLQGGLGMSLQDYYNYPRFINLETINNCTARCAMCGIEEWRKNIKKAYMDDTLFDKIKEDILSHKTYVQKIAMFVGNEPLMDKNLAKRIKVFTDNNIKVSITSNASLMDKDRAIELLNSKLERVNFSIDSLDKKTYESIRVGLNFENTLGNILQFIKLRDMLKSKTRVRISLIKNELYKKDIPNIVQFFEKFLNLELGDGIKIDDLSLSLSNKTNQTRGGVL